MIVANAKLNRPQKDYTEQGETYQTEGVLRAQF